jgi:hypothetical protein
MSQDFPNGIPGDVLRRWMLRAALVGFGVGGAAAMTALMN